MTVENHWRQLKHQYLRFTHRPRLDHAIYVICTNIVPAYMVTAANLEDSHRIGRTKSLTPFCVAFKRNWRKKASAKVSGRKYTTSIALWQCNCGAQETDPHHLCKHLVQAVPTPPALFFTEVIRRRSAPLYRHPCLHTADSPVGHYSRLEDGSVTDGDDHEGIGGHALLTKAVRDDSGIGGWAEVVSGIAKERLKRTRVAEGSSGDSPDGAPSPQRRRIAQGEDDEGEDEEKAEVSRGSNGTMHRRFSLHQLSQMLSLKGSLTTLADRLQQSADLLRSQIPHENAVWMRSIRSELNSTWEDKLTTLLRDIHLFERNGTSTTWARNSKEQRASKHTMGYQLQSSRTIELD